MEIRFPEKNDTIVTSLKKHISNEVAMGRVPEFSQSDIAFAIWIDWLKLQNDKFKSIAIITDKFYKAYLSVYEYSIKRSITLQEWKIYQDVYTAAKILGIDELIKEFDRIESLIPKSVVKSLKKQLNQVL